MNNYTKIPLKAAHSASLAFQSMALLYESYPGLGLSLDQGIKLLNGIVVRITSRHTASREKPQEVKPALCLVKETRRQEKRAETEVRSPWEPSTPQESSRCKALLLEILRRAAHDWVLYRSHTEITKRECAQDAYTWLFKEDERHSAGRQRATARFELDDEGEVVGARNITSFLGICEVLDLEPDVVRRHVRKMDIQTIISAGRPAETRRVKQNDMSGVEEASLSIGVEVDIMPRHQEFETRYESYGSVATPDMLSYNSPNNWY